MVAVGAAAVLLCSGPSAVMAAVGPAAHRQAGTVTLSTLPDCGLGISVYPDFRYNPHGGGGVGTFVREGDSIVRMTWDADSMNIPPLRYDTTTLFGIPLPPPLQISIHPTQLAGTLATETGQAELQFDATFNFTAGPLYKVLRCALLIAGFMIMKL